MKKITKLLLVCSSLFVTAGVLASCNNNNSQTQTENNKCNVLFLLDDTFTIEEVSGFNLTNEGYASVEKGTLIEFKVNVSDTATVGDDGLIVKVGDNEIASINGVYKIIVSKDIKITVDGFVYETTKHRISVDVPYGVSVISEEKEALPDGGYIIEEDSFSFSLDYLPSFKPQNLEVKVNGSVITANNGIYTVSVTDNVTISVSGVIYEQITIPMAETDLFSFTNVKGATLKNGNAYVNEETVSFRIVPSILCDVSSSELVVKHSGNVLTPVNDVYSFAPTSSSTIEVSGLNKIVESCASTQQSFKRQIIADSAVKPIVNTIVSGEVNHLADINNGYKKATYFAGEYAANQISLNSTDNFEKYNHLEFEVNPISGDYLEFFSPTSGGKALFYIHDKGWTKVEINKENDGYHYIVAGQDKGVVASKETMISSLQFKMQGTYLFSEFIAQKDPEYVDPHQFIDRSVVDGLDFVSQEETEYGMQKWYGPIKSKINVGIPLTNLDAIQYKEIYFEVKVPSDYEKPVWFGVAKNPSWEVKPGEIGKFIFTKNANEYYDLDFISTSTKSVANIDLTDGLDVLSIYGHSSIKEGNTNVGSFYVSNPRVVVDEEYDPNGQKNVTITNSASHVTYTVDNQTTDTFKVDADSTVTLRVTPESGYTAKVIVNDAVVKGNNNVYEITISKNTTIEITEEIAHTIEKVADKFIECATLVEKTYDNTFTSIDPNIEKMYESTATGETHYALSNINISEYKHLYFYVKNVSGTVLQLYEAISGTSGYKGVGSSGNISKVSFDNNNGTWTVSIDDVATDKYTKTTNTLSGIFFVQFWGKNIISPLYGYKA